MKALGKKFPKTIYFLNDMLATDKEMAAAEKIGPGVVFRNAQYVPANPNPGQIEECDAVAGAVPPAYAAKYKTVGEKSAKTESETPPPTPVVVPEPEEQLIGTGAQPASWALPDGTVLQLGTVVAEAFKRSGATIKHWNAAPQEARDAEIALVVKEMVPPVANDGWGQTPPPTPAA